MIHDPYHKEDHWLSHSILNVVRQVVHGKVTCFRLLTLVTEESLDLSGPGLLGLPLPLTCLPVPSWPCRRCCAWPRPRPRLGRGRGSCLWFPSMRGQATAPLRRRGRTWQQERGSEGGLAEEAPHQGYGWTFQAPARTPARPIQVARDRDKVEAGA